MLWLRAWLETKWRIGLTVVWLAFFVGVLAASPVAGRPGTAMLDALGRLLNMLAIPCLFVPVWLAGSGVRTQAGFGRNASRGIHGSTHFTLSLPVTRTRLLLTRGAVGLIETAGVLLALGLAAWILFPVLRQGVAPADGAQHLIALFVCGFAFYGLSTLTATLLDDTWHMWSSTLVILALWSPQVRQFMPPAFDVFRPLSETSPLFTHTLPWTAMAVSAVVGAMFVLVAVQVVERQEY